MPVNNSTSIPTFKTVEAYQAYVRGSEVTKLPAAVKLVQQDQMQFGSARAALEARKKEVGYGGFEAAKSQAERALDEANHPLRKQAEAIQAQIPALSSQSAELEGKIVRLQSEISQIQVNRQSELDQTSGSDGSLAGALLSVAASGAVFAANQSVINSDQREIQALIMQKSRLDADIMTKTTTAATLAVQPGTPEAIKPFQEALAKADQDLARANDAIKPQASAVAGAEATLNQDASAKDRLDNLDRQLKDYDSRFSGGTRASLWWNDHAWKAKLDTFMKGVDQ